MSTIYAWFIYDGIFDLYAFGTLMEVEGIPSVPSMDYPYPLKEDSYFTGGYSTRRYTSSDYPKVFDWQIESNYEGIRETEVGRQAFSNALTKAIITYMEEHMSYNPK